MAYNFDDSRELQKAIRESMQDRNSTTATQFGALTSGESAAAAQTPSRRANIEDRIKEISLRPASELPLVNDSSGDTWIFIDPSPKQPEQDDVEYSRYLEHYETPMQVKKQSLLRYSASNPADGFNLEKLFGPSEQFRTIRRRKLTMKLREHPKVKYVIDLTPPVEGEDAVFLTTELCCSHGVRLWYQASDIWNVSTLLVGGKEEYASNNGQDLVRIFNHKADGDLANVSKSPSEYSPVRHRSAIERVVAALMDIDPKLDSAPKVWTAFAVANYFGLKNSPVTDYIIRWLRAYPNSFFLEVCPEVSLRIADGLESHDLARDAFAILVGEAALDSLYRDRCESGYSAYGRKKEDLPEKFFSRIEYASKSLQERISNDFENLIGCEMRWLEDLPEVQKLFSITQPRLQGTVSALVKSLKDYVRGTVYKVLCANYHYVPPPDFHHDGGHELIRRCSRARIWSSLSIGERILSRSFWLALVSFTLFENSTNLEFKQGWGLADHRSSWEEERELRLGTYREVRNQELNDLVREGSRLLSEQDHQPKVALPDRTRLRTEDKPLRPYELPFRPHRPKDELFGAQITTYDKATKDELFGTHIAPYDNGEATQKPTATEPINIPRSTPKPKAPSFGSDSDVIPAHLVASEDTTKSWPFGGSRPDAAVIVKEQQSVMPDSNWTTAIDEVIAQQLEEDQFWAGCTPIDHEEEDARSTPPFFRSPQPSPRKSLLPLPKTDPESKKSWMSAPVSTPFFDLREFFLQAKMFIEAYARRKLQYADHLVREEPHEVGITNTLVCLEDSEWKYLPLWAGGYDDDTGGVFNDQLPTADMGFSTCGPGVHTGFTPANSDVASSEYEMVDNNEYDAETINTSMANNRSFARPINRRHVYAADSMESSSGDDFDMVTADEEFEVEDARKLTEAQEQLEMAQDREEAARKACTTRGTPEHFVDGDYADLFNDSDDDDGDDDDDSFMHEDIEDSDTVMV